MIHALAILLMSVHAHAGNEVIRGFRLRSCAAESCVLVESTEARRTPIDSAYAFRHARVSVWSKGVVKTTLDVGSGYYEPDLGYLVMHGRGLINLASGRLTLISARELALTGLDQ